METLKLLWVFDAVLVLALLVLAWKSLASPDLYKAIVLFIAFGLLMALAWVRLNAPDIALAEAAIGAGLTGAILLTALAKLEAMNKTKNQENSTTGLTMNKKTVTDSHNKQTLFRLLLMALLSVLATGLAYAVLSIPSQTPGLGELATKNLDVSGVSHAVTAVLLNYRAYDTLLEMGVVLLALVAVWSLGNVSKQHKPSSNAVLDMLAHLLVPLLILVAGYLLWAGAHAPGGAFQAGSLLAAAGVLLLLSGWHVGARFMGLPLRIVLVAGLFMFLLIGAGVMLSGQAFLEYPLPYAGALILLIEAAATFSIGLTLAALFLGGRLGSGSRVHGEQE